MRMSRRAFMKMALMGVTGLAVPLGALSVPLARINRAEPVRGPAIVTQPGNRRDATVPSDRSKYDPADGVWNGGAA